VFTVYLRLEKILQEHCKKIFSCKAIKKVSLRENLLTSFSRASTAAPQLGLA
jgi:hypothetical protein